MIEELLFGMASHVCPHNNLTDGRMCVFQAGFLGIVFSIRSTKFVGKKLPSLVQLE